MKQWLKCYSVLVATTLLFCGCQDVSNPPAQGANQTREQLMVWSYYETTVQSEGLDELVERFNGSQDRYEIAWEYVPMSEFDKKISRAYTEQELPDVVIMDNPDMMKFIQMDMFEDITEYAQRLNLDSEYYAASVSTTTYKGRYYGVPFNSNNVCLIYRPDLLEEAGVTVPTDWQEFDAAVRKLTQNDNYGFLMSCMDGEQGSFQLMSWIMSDTKRSDQLDANAIQEAFSLLANLVNDGCMPAECLEYTQTDVARRFIEGDIAMMENGPWVFRMLDEAGIDYSLAPMPANKRQAVILGGENLGVIRGKNIEGAIEFIKFCMEEGGVEDFCSKAELLPSRMEAANHLIEKQPELSIIGSQMEYAIPRTTIDSYNSISKNLPSLFAKVVVGEKTAEEAGAELVK